MSVLRPVVHGRVVGANEVISLAHFVPFAIFVSTASSLIILVLYVKFVVSALLVLIMICLNMSDLALRC